MTREEHLDWCKEQAKIEMAYYNEGSKGIISMMSDLEKHPETINHSGKTLLVVALLMNPKISIQEANKLIDGFR